MSEDSWDRHFARIIRVTVARMRERDERVDKGLITYNMLRLPSAQKSTVTAVVGVAGCNSPNVHTRKEEA